MMGGHGVLGWLLNPPLLLLLLLHTPQVAGQRLENVRLSGGAGPHEGNLEIELEGVWRFVCDDDFGFRAANMVCRNLGYSHAERFTRNNHFGDKSPGWRRKEVKYWVDGSYCSFSNDSLRNCTLRYLDDHDCGPTEIAGVVCATGECSSDEFACSTVTTNVSCVPRSFVCNAISDCTDESDEDPGMCEDVGVVKLMSHIQVNLPGAALGTVFVKHQQQWGTVCDDGFDLNDVKVICRSLGFEGGWMTKFTHAYLGPGSGPIHLADLRCSGEEEWVGQCNGTAWGEGFCFHGEDAGVFCYDGGLEVRLAGGDSSDAGRVEVQVDGQWGALCHNGFDDFDAQVVCRMLGYEGEAAANGDSHFGPGRGPVWDLVLDCQGSEDHLQGCMVKVSNDTCSQDTTAGVTCSNSAGRLDEALKSVLPSNCGVPLDPTYQFLGPLARLRGGSFTTEFDAPWLASLRASFEGRELHVCGATIISQDYVLTAGVCLNVFGKSSVYVRVGDYHGSYTEADQEDFLIDKVWIHEEFKSVSFENNIALVKIERNYGRGISLGPRVKPVCLPGLGDSYDDLTSCSVVSKGVVDDPTRVSSVPKQAKVNIQNDTYCEAMARGSYTSSMVCAGDTENEVGMCAGDEGSPLTCLVDGRHTLYGIGSFPQDCRLFGRHGVYTRVTKFLRWIHNIIVNDKGLTISLSTTKA